MIADLPSAWPLPAAARRDAQTHIEYVQQVAVLTSLQQWKDQVTTALNQKGIQLSTANQTTTTGGGTTTTTEGPPGASGHGATFTTEAVANSGGSYLIPVEDGTAFLNGEWIYTTDGTNSILGQIARGGQTEILAITASTAITVGTPTSLATSSPVTWSGSGGTVQSVGLSLPAIFNVSGSPVTTSGTITATLANESANAVLAGPTSGSASAPTFRALTSADIPSLNYVTGVGLTLPSIFSVSGSPVTSSGTLAASLTTQSANTVFAGPSSGSAAPTFRALTSADIPSLAYVASVGLSLPGIFTVSGSPVTGSPVTGSGTLAASLAAQSANTIFAGPSSGSASSPAFRSMALADLPATYSNIGAGLAQGSIVYVNSSGDLTTLAPGTSGQFLKTGGSGANPSWAAGSGSPAGSSTQVQFNSSGSFSGDSGFTYGGQGGTTLVTLTPTSTSANALQLTAPASFAGNWIQCSDGTGNNNVILGVGANNYSPQLDLYCSYNVSGAGSSSPAVRFGQAGYGAAGFTIGGLVGGLLTASNAWNPTARINFVAGENQSSGHYGTEIWFYVTPKGSMTPQQQVLFSANGNVVTNNTGSALSTSASDGFLYVPSCRGAPSGTPTSYAGTVPLVYDTVHNKLYVYNGSWQGVLI